MIIPRGRGNVRPPAVEKHSPGWQLNVFNKKMAIIQSTASSQHFGKFFGRSYTTDKLYYYTPTYYRPNI